jgi:hypothetical protein
VSGQPIVVDVVLTNTGPVTKWVPPALPSVNLTFAITNALGRQVALREYRHGDPAPGVAVVEVPPHGCLGYPVDLTRYYELEPGTYQIRAVRDLTREPPWGRVVASSAPVALQILPPENHK